MKIQIKIILALLTLLFATQTSATENNTKKDSNQQMQKVVVNVSIYDLKNEDPSDSSQHTMIDNYAEFIKSNKLEHQPRLVILAGKPAMIEIGSQNQHGQDINMIRIQFSVNKTATQFDLNFEMIQGNSKSGSQISAINIGKQLMFTIELDQEKKLIIVNTELYNE